MLAYTEFLENMVKCSAVKWLMMVRFHKFKNWLTVEDLLYHPLVYWTHFGALGA